MTGTMPWGVQVGNAGRKYIMEDNVRKKHKHTESETRHDSMTGSNQNDLLSIIFLTYSVFFS